jgi:hypothetical protein
MNQTSRDCYLYTRQINANIYSCILSEKVKFICTSFRNRWKIESLASFLSLFHSDCKFYIYQKCTYIVFYPAITKSPKHLPNCLKIAETSVVLIVFNGVICDVSAKLLPFLSVCTLHESGTRNALLGPPLDNTEVY